MRRRVWMGKIQPSHTQRLMCILGRHWKPEHCLTIIVSSLRLPISDTPQRTGYAARLRTAKCHSSLTSCRDVAHIIGPPPIQ